MRKGGANLTSCVCSLARSLGVSLQEVNATPVRFISDLLVEDAWSHVFMDTLAPRGFVKVRRHNTRVQRRQQARCGAKQRLLMIACLLRGQIVLYTKLLIKV